MSDMTCRYCKHRGIIIDPDPINCERPLKKYCPPEYFFDHPNPTECKNFDFDEELWKYDNLPRGKTLKTIMHPNGVPEPILECPKCHNTGTPYYCKDFVLLDILLYRCVKCGCEFRTA